MSDVDIIAMFHRFDDLDIRILDLIYIEDITVLLFIIKKLKVMAHRATITKRIKYMANIGLVGIIKSTNPLCLYKGNHNSEIVIEIIKRFKVKRGLL